MQRRNFLQSVAAAAAMPAAPQATAKGPSLKTTLFLDHWHLDLIQSAELRLGQPELQPEATYKDPLLEGMSSWPTVWRDEVADKYRMLYSAKWRPLTLLAAESADGYEWRPTPHPSIQPEGGKLAPHHLFTLPSGSGGSTYLDPIAEDGYPFKIYARTIGSKRYRIKHPTLVSRDGVHWQADPTATWNKPHWHAEPPIYGYYNHHTRHHTLTSRPGHGDRRVTILTSPDAHNWSAPELLLQPDPADPPLLQFYGLPVFAYEGHYIGLLWTMHCDDSMPPASFNHFVAPIDSQLAYSFDGIRFQRSFRIPFVALPHGYGLIQPSSLIDAGDELRIYSTASRAQHGMSRRFAGRQQGLHSITLHTLRRDGFTYIESTGNQARILTKPVALFAPELLLNAATPHGEVQYQLTAIDGSPLPGLTFEECVPLKESDQIRYPLRWKNSSPPLNKPIRVEFRFLQARIYALRGRHHFLDAQDMHLLNDGQPIDPRWFDF